MKRTTVYKWVTRFVRELLASKQISVLEDPPYSPDLARNDFFLLQNIKKIIKGTHFDGIDDIRSSRTAFHEINSKLFCRVY
ncbi:hypothetical protein B7P43_G03179 [Cryptotermes secundus]|uniref:Mos1 transposase HTH domain-containing protein n=1 Tax=Cryptotermes secundus TaxID=105785 RepID=A0A2J7RG66_9NEOP|nr:hypothetical protein B7P43_G03179 [Cryptotermes secundus]